MIDSIEIKNFKSIKSKKIDLKNLNVLLGMNGQGKSSFIQSLLLLRQSKENLNKGVINLNGELVRIGEAKDALYQYASENKMSFFIQFRDEKNISLLLNYKADLDILQSINSIEISPNILKEEALFSNKFQYLYADRVHPKSLHDKSYSTVSIDKNLGKKGEFTVHYLEINGSDPVVFENCLHKDSKEITDNKNKKYKDKSLIHQVNLWLGEISPGVHVKTDNITSDFVELSYEFTQPRLGVTNAFKPENVGFGISYGLHVVTALLSAQPGSLIIIENPESHIHPKGQSELGKLIALVSQNDVQVIIETHSDHIVNGIRVGVKEHKVDKEKVKLFYFKKIINDIEQFSSIIDIYLDSNGTLSEEPEGLLDEWGNQLLKLL